MKVPDPDPDPDPSIKKFKKIKEIIEKTLKK
jgi:hypothetical protein